MTDRTNPYADQWSIFRSNTADHRFTILHDDGTYRHVRMARRDSSGQELGLWAWDVIAWPGHLAVVGDIGGGFVFVRERDMFDFFNTERYGDHYGDGSPYLQADYWAGKLTHACSDAAWAYGSALILTQVRAHLEEAVLDGDISQDVADRLIVEAGRHADTEDTIREWLFTTSPFNEYDTWEWQYRSLSHHYLVACYAIVTAVRTYRAARTETPHPSVTDLVRTDRGGPVA